MCCARRQHLSKKRRAAVVAAAMCASLPSVILLLRRQTAQAADSAASPSASPAAGTAAYVYHLDGNLENSGSAGAKGNLTDNGFASFEPSPLGEKFGKAAVDSPKMGKNHVKVPLYSLTDGDGSFTVEAIFQMPATDPAKAKFTIASYGGEEDAGAKTAGGGLYLNYNADADAKPAPGTPNGRVQFVVDNRVRPDATSFRRQVMINALVPVMAEAGKTYRVVASWDNVAGQAMVGWSPLTAGDPTTMPLVTLIAKPTGQAGLVINGTDYFLTVGGAESEDGGNGFAAGGVKIDDVKFVAGVEKDVIAEKK